MPVTVPRLSEPSVSTRPLATPNVPTSVDPASLGVTRGVDTGGLTAAAQDIYQRETQKANEVAILDADSKLSALETKVLYDPQTGALTRRGKDALGARAQVSDQWTKGADAIEAGLSNDMQRIRFRQAATSRAASIESAVAQHVYSETKRYEDETLQGYLKNEYDGAIAGWKDPQRVEDAQQRQYHAIADYGERNGLPAEEIQEKQAEAVSKTTLGVVEQILAAKPEEGGGDLAAKAFYEKHKQQIVGDDSVRVEEQLKLGSTRGESQRQADKIMTSSTNLTEAIAQVKQLTDPDVRDATEARVRKAFAEQKEGEREVREQNMLTATDIIEKTGDTNRIPGPIWHNFTLMEREELKRYAMFRAKGEPVATDWGTWTRLQQLAADPETRDDFLKLNPMAYRSRLANSEFKELVELHSSMVRGDSKAESRLAGIRSTQAIIGASLKGVGINPNPKPGSDDAQRVDLFGRAVSEESILFEEQNKRKPNDKELQGIVDNLLVRGTIAGTGIFGHFMSHERAFERQAGEGDFIVDARDVPRGERAKIEAALKRKNAPVTDAAVLRMYQQKLASMVPSATQ